MLLPPWDGFAQVGRNVMFVCITHQEKRYQEHLLITHFCLSWACISLPWTSLTKLLTTHTQPLTSTTAWLVARLQYPHQVCFQRKTLQIWISVQDTSCDCREQPTLHHYLETSPLYNSIPCTVTSAAATLLLTAGSRASFQKINSWSFRKDGTRYQF